MKLDEKKKKFVVSALINCRASFRGGISDVIDALQNDNKGKAFNKILMLRKQATDINDILQVAEELLEDGEINGNK